MDPGKRRRALKYVAIPLDRAHRAIDGQGARAIQSVAPISRASCQMSLVDIFNALVNLVAGHPYLAYLTAGGAAFCEAVAIIGVVFPGSLLILGLSALVPTGALSLVPLILCTAGGAITGDVVSYGLGWRYRQGIVRMRPFSTHPRWLGRGRLFFRRHGHRSVFMARFVRGPHAIVPLLAGIMRMRWRSFLFMDVAAALIWAPLHVMLGVAIGASLALASAVAARLALFIIVLAAVVMLIVWSVRALLRRLLPRVAVVEAALWRWAGQHPGWLARQIRSLLDANAGELRGLAVLLGILVVAIWIFFGVLQDVISGDPLVKADVAVYHLLQALRTSWADQLMIRITELGDTAVALPVAAAVAAWLLSRRAWRTLAYWVGTVLLAEGLTLAFKAALRIPRPIALYSGWAAFSFPSGHATVNTALYTFLTFLIARELPPRRRGVPIATTATLLALIDLSRLYLGAHWLSDVIAGSALACALSASMAIAYRHHVRTAVGGYGLLATAVLAVIGFGTWHSLRQYPVDVHRYAVRQSHTELSARSWWQGAWRTLPARRMDLAGLEENPLDLQYAGRLSSLRQHLERLGWTPPVPWTVSSTLQWLSPAPAPLQLPVVPQMNDGRSALLVLVAPPSDAASNERWVLRLWRSGVQLVQPGRPAVPLWTGAISQQRLTHPLSLLTLAVDEPDTTRARAQLARQIPGSQVVYRHNVAPASPWDGGVLLARGANLK